MEIAILIMLIMIALGIVFGLFSLRSVKKDIINTIYTESGRLFRKIKDKET